MTPTPWKNHLQHQTVTPNQFATDTWLARQSLQVPSVWAIIFWWLLGAALMIGFGLSVFAVIGWLLGIVSF